MTAIRPAMAVIISSSQSLGSAPTIAGTGLAASYYQFSANILTLAAGDALVAGASGPTATFTALTVCFPSCGTTEDDGNTLSSYIALNGTNLIGNAILGNAVTLYSGYIAIRTAGVYTFDLGSDDGSSLSIGGLQVIDNDDRHNLNDVQTSVTFQSAGLYAFSVDHFEAGGSTGVTVLENGIALATSDLYESVPLPEPATIAVLGTGAVCVSLFRRRRRARSGPAPKHRATWLSRVPGIGRRAV